MSRMSRVPIWLGAMTIALAIGTTLADAGPQIGCRAHWCKDREYCGGACYGSECTGGGHPTDGCDPGRRPCLCVLRPFPLYTPVPECAGFSCIPSCPNPPCPFLTDGGVEQPSAASEDLERHPDTRQCRAGSEALP